MPDANCPICNGSGWRVVEHEGISAASRCACFSHGRSQRIEERAGIPPLYQNASIDNFRRNFDNPIAAAGLGDVLLKVQGFLREFPAVRHPGLLFMGLPGTGKTHLAVAVLRALIARGFEGVFFDFQNLLDRIRSSYDKTSGTSDKEAYHTALEAEILLLDDLGAHRITDWVEDTVTSIITHRCNHKKSTLVTTNLRDPDPLDWRDLPRSAASAAVAEAVASKQTLEERIGARARSRLHEMCITIKMPHIEDYRTRR